MARHAAVAAAVIFVEVQVRAVRGGRMAARAGESVKFRPFERCKEDTLSRTDALLIRHVYARTPKHVIRVRLPPAPARIQERDARTTSVGCGTAAEEQRAEKRQMGRGDG
jgi:hypothetical protein